MQNIYKEVESLDKRCYENFSLTPELLMEHAALGIYNHIKKNFNQDAKILILTGAGNNGADGIALARLLHGEFDTYLFNVLEPKSDMAHLQQKRAKAVELKRAYSLIEADIYVDCIFGSGLKRALSHEIDALIKELNLKDGYKIACDIPTGIGEDGEHLGEVFKANITLTMGAYKLSCFLDKNKSYVGKIEVINLGLPQKSYEIDSPYKLLEMSDLKLPLRDKKDVHKGSFGHLGVFCGDKKGASTIAAHAALSFGAGLVSVISQKEIELSYELMQSTNIPSSCTALALGMGYGSNNFTNELIEKLLPYPLVLDADIFYFDGIIDILKESKNTVLTPHPKEFISLLKIANIADISINELQEKRFFYSKLFSTNFPNITLLLKGANVIIAQNGELFINPHGTNALSKGGSGDVLSGLIGALLAQNYSPLKAAISGSLAHTKAIKGVKKSNFALTPKDLIESVSYL